MVTQPIIASASGIGVSPRLAVGFKWDNLPVEVKFKYDGTDLSGDGSADDEKAAISEAMKLWNGVDDADKMVQLSLINIPSSNDIVCKDAGYDYIGKTEPVFVSGSNNTILYSADVLLNTNQYWTTKDTLLLKYNVQSIVGHELGHVLGVAHCHQSTDSIEGTSSENTECVSSTCKSNIMQPKIAQGQEIKTLTDYDKSSYRLIYFDDIQKQE